MTSEQDRARVLADHIWKEAEASGRDPSWYYPLAWLSRWLTAYADDDRDGLRAATGQLVRIHCAVEEAQGQAVAPGKTVARRFPHRLDAPEEGQEGAPEAEPT